MTPRRLPAPGGERARRRRRRCAPSWTASPRASRPASPGMVRYDPTRFVAESIREVLDDALRGDAAGLPRRLRLPPGLARDADPGDHDPGLADRHLRGARARSASSINTITLFALVLAIGLVVDDAIVVVENVARLLGEGVSRREAVRRSMGEVTSAIVASTLVLGAVFVPVAFLPGTTGLMLRQFGLAVTERRADLAAERADPLAGALRALHAARARAQERASSAASTAASARVVHALRPRRARAAAAAGARARHLRGARRRRPSLLFRSVPTGFLPDEDQGYFITSFQLPDGASLERTDEVARQIESDPARTRRASSASNLFGGFDVLTGTFPPNVGSIFVTLAPWDERGASASRSRRSSPQVRPQLAAHPGRARVRAEPGADPRPLADGRLRVPAPGPRGRRPPASSPPWPSAIIDEGNALAGAPQPLHDLPAERAADLRRPRPRRRRRRSACRSTTSSRRCRPSWAASTSTTSTASAGSSASTRRPRATCARSPRTSSGCGCARSAARWCRSRRCVALERIAGPRDIPHYNVLPLREASRARRRPASARARRSTAWRRSRAEVLPATMSFEWTGTAYQERQPGSEARPDPRALAAGRVPVPRGAVRELEPAARDHAGGAARLPRRARRAVAARARQRSLLPDRPRHADRARRPRTRS